LYQLKGTPGIWHEACLEIEDASLETQSDGLIENQNAPRENKLARSETAW
jgi:hypothetical protein